MLLSQPTNAISADAFLEPCDGFSIGSNDLTQMTLGIDRDSGLVSNDFVEGDPSVKFLIQVRCLVAVRGALSDSRPAHAFLACSARSRRRARSASTAAFAARHLPMTPPLPSGW